MDFDRRWFIFLIPFLGQVLCRPQSTDNLAVPAIEYLQNGIRFPKWLPHPQLGFYESASNSLNKYPQNVLFYPLQYNFPTYSFQRFKVNPVEEKLDKEIKSISEEFAKIPKIEDPKLLPQKKGDAEQQTSPLVIQKPLSLAPYKYHPLFHYIKNGNTIDQDKIIRFRNPNRDDKEVTTLILKPVARSIAGVDGKAMATPVSKAILRKGMSVDILFEPDAIAIAGPGGIAHAESDLEISYEDDYNDEQSK